jgi:hypothetical protein
MGTARGTAGAHPLSRARDVAGSGADRTEQPSLRDTELLQAALGLGTPWSVSASRFDEAARRLDIDIAFPKGARFACPSLYVPDVRR